MFKRWCIQQNFVTKTPNSDVSHVLLDGGRLSVPFDRLNDFHEEYIKAVKAGEKLFVVEQKTPNYNFFVDIDYKDTRALTIEEIQDICKVICDKVKRHRGGDCIISVAQPKKVGEFMKTGVHLNWPGYVVNQASALALREHILVALSKAKGGTDWNEVIDAAVYGDIKRRTRGSGLRMPWSYKLAKHTSCGGRGCEGRRPLITIGCPTVRSRLVSSLGRASLSSFNELSAWDTSNCLSCSCGSAKTSETLCTGVHGTPTASKRSSQWLRSAFIKSGSSR